MSACTWWWRAALAAFFGCIGTAADAEVVSKAKVGGATYWVDVKVSGSTAAVWFRHSATATSSRDIRALELRARSLKMKDAAQLVCRGKQVYDEGRTIAGCAVTAATGICLASTAPSAGASTAVCSAVYVYTAQRGFADCLDGLSGTIARRLGREREWDQVRLHAQIATGQWHGAIDKAIDLACRDVR